MTKNSTPAPTHVFQFLVSFFVLAAIWHFQFRFLPKTTLVTSFVIYGANTRPLKMADVYMQFPSLCDIPLQNLYHAIL